MTYQSFTEGIGGMNCTCKIGDLDKWRVPADYSLLPVNYNKPHKCPICDGSGGTKHPLTGFLAASVCRSCEGKGIVWG